MAENKIPMAPRGKTPKVEAEGPAGALLEKPGVNAFIYTYSWKNNPKRATMAGRRCRVVKFGAKNSVKIEFEDGQREIVSRYALRRTRGKNCQDKKEKTR